VEGGKKSGLPQHKSDRPLSPDWALSQIREQVPPPPLGRRRTRPPRNPGRRPPLPPFDPCHPLSPPAPPGAPMIRGGRKWGPSRQPAADPPNVSGLTKRKASLALKPRPHLGEKIRPYGEGFYSKKCRVVWAKGFLVPRENPKPNEYRLGRPVTPKPPRGGREIWFKPRPTKGWDRRTTRRPAGAGLCPTDGLVTPRRGLRKRIQAYPERAARLFAFTRAAELNR